MINKSGLTMKLKQIGSEKRWNRYGEPFKQFCNFKIIDTWLNRKTTKKERKYKEIINANDSR